MSSDKTDETEQLIIKLLKKMERKGKKIQTVLWKLMNYFENEQIDEKKDENKINNMNNNAVSLLYTKTAINVCKIGHTINTNTFKHLSVEACVICGHKNNSNQQNKMKTRKEILQFINQYDIHQVSFGPNYRQKKQTNLWISRGWDKKWPLHVAARTGDITTIKQLCENKNIDANQKLADWDDALPVSVATRWGQLHVLIELIKHGANPIPPPDKSNDTPYKTAVNNQHKAILLFYEQYVQFAYGFDINKDTNIQCHYCYNYDWSFNKHLMNGTMANYVYCTKCTAENVKQIKIKREENEIIERRIVRTLKQNPSISVDTLCQMKDAKSLQTILKEITVSGEKYCYSLWLLDIDNFKLVNSHLTHAVADTKIQALGEILKELELKTWRQWSNSGYDGLDKVHAFRQGGDEFALVVYGDHHSKVNTLQNLYERLMNKINTIRLEKIPSMPHITVSIGVCMCHLMDDYQEIMKQADLASEVIKKDGKNGMSIYYGQTKQFYKRFNDIPF